MSNRPLNPVDAEAAILSASNEVAEGIGHVSRLYDAFTTAQHTFDQAWARCYVSSTGPVEERKQTCILNTAEEAEALRVADVAYRYAKSRLSAAEARLSAMQSILKSVMQAYAAAGRGEN